MKLTHTQRVAATTAVNCVAYALWTFLNKWLFLDMAHGGLGLTTPLLATAVQMAVAGLISAIALSCGSYTTGWRTGSGRSPLPPSAVAQAISSATVVVVASGDGSSRHTANDRSAPPPPTHWSSRGAVAWMLPPRRLWSRVLPLGIARSVDIGAANAALVFVSIAAQQVMKSMLPIFVCVLSWAWLRKPIPPAAWACLVPIVVGTYFAVSRHVENATPTAGSRAGAAHGAPPMMTAESYGVLLAGISCAGRAFKAVFNGVLLGMGKQPRKHAAAGSGAASQGQGNGSGSHAPSRAEALHSGLEDEGEKPSVEPEVEERIEPLDILRLEAPMSALILLGTSLLFELGWNGGGGTTKLPPPQVGTTADVATPAAVSLLWLCVGGALMFLNQSTYIQIIDLTSPVTCQILMNMKMLMLIVVAVYRHHTPYTAVNAGGVVIAVTGCLTYGWVLSRAEGGASRRAHSTAKHV